jgi:hypothetical protein
MQPAHQIAHVPPNLASFRAGLHPQYAARRRAAKQHNLQNIRLNDRNYGLLVKAGHTLCLDKRLAFPRQYL